MRIFATDFHDTDAIFHMHIKLILLKDRTCKQHLHLTVIAFHIKHQLEENMQTIQHR